MGLTFRWNALYNGLHYKILHFYICHLSSGRKRTQRMWGMIPPVESLMVCMIKRKTKLEKRLHLMGRLYFWMKKVSCCILISTNLVESSSAIHFDAHKDTSLFFLCSWLFIFRSLTSNNILSMKLCNLAFLFLTLRSSLQNKFLLTVHHGGFGF